MWLLLLGCVLDRTGQSSTDQIQKALADHQRRLAELEAVSEDISRRVGQLEEVTRARGQDEILKMETMEQLRQEVATIRGEFEVLQHDYRTYEQAGLGFQQDSDWRQGYTEARIQAIERALGLKAPPPPPKEGEAAPATAPPEGPPVAEAEPELVLDTPDAYFQLITQHLQAGNGGAARAVARRFITDNPKHERVAEAYYRVAESYQNESAYADAAAAFQDVVDKYPQSTWAPWSMLRQGECFDALGRKDAAKLFWQDVVAKYPKSKAAKEAKAHLDAK